MAGAGSETKRETAGLNYNHKTKLETQHRLTFATMKLKVLWAFSSGTSH